MGNLFKLFLQLVVLIKLTTSSNQYQESDGWRMVDRFYGFRYELLNCPDVNFEAHIQKIANQMGCFGWIQRLPIDSSSNNGFKLVGEGRCSKMQGPLFHNKIKTDCSSDMIEKIKFNDMIYADTKIRLHFSSFKILEPSRETCFLNEPHQCNDNDTDGNSNYNANSVNKDEL